MLDFFLHTDLGHDPDDAVALGYLLEKNFIPDRINITPGYIVQNYCVSGILKEHGVKTWLNNPAPGNTPSLYDIGKHKMFEQNVQFAGCFNSATKYRKSLIIGPAKGIERLQCDEMYFQGGYSPNSINPLEKFKGVRAAPSFNPNGARKEFNQLVESNKIKTKYFIGKNVCHGFTKEKLAKIWKPKNKKMLEFFNLLKQEKKMHDVLAAMLFVDKELGIWERAKPLWVGGKLTTIPTDEEIYTLVGVNI